MNELHPFLTGASSLGFAIAAVFFFRFWRDTRDRLFVLFAVAFVALAFNRALVGFTLAREATPHIYFIRLAAFVIIAGAIVDKNRR